MRYLLLSVLVVCVIGIMIPSAFAQSPAQVLQQCKNAGGVIVFPNPPSTSGATCKLGHQAYVQQQLDRQYQQNAQVEAFFEFVKYAILIIVATVSAILIIVGFAKSRKKGTPAFCQNCRTVLRLTSKFCPKCGNQV